MKSSLLLAAVALALVVAPAATGAGTLTVNPDPVARGATFTLSGCGYPETGISFEVAGPRKSGIDYFTAAEPVDSQRVLQRDLDRVVVGRRRLPDHVVRPRPEGRPQEDDRRQVHRHVRRPAAMRLRIVLAALAASACALASAAAAGQQSIASCDGVSRLHGDELSLRRTASTSASRRAAATAPTRPSRSSAASPARSSTRRSSTSSSSRRARARARRSIRPPAPASPTSRSRWRSAGRRSSARRISRSRSAGQPQRDPRPEATSSLGYVFSVRPPAGPGRTRRR